MFRSCRRRFLCNPIIVNSGRKQICNCRKGSFVFQVHENSIFNHNFSPHKIMIIMKNNFFTNSLIVAPFKKVYLWIKKYCWVEVFLGLNVIFLKCCIKSIVWLVFHTNYVHYHYKNSFSAYNNSFYHALHCNKYFFFQDSLRQRRKNLKNSVQK